MIQIAKTIQFRIAILIVSMFLTTLQAPAMEGEPEAQFVLERLDKIYVGVDSDSINKLGLDGASVKSAIESKLSSSGMKIASQSEYLNHPEINRLLITAKAMKHQGKWFYALTLGLTEFVFLDENADRRVTVWAWRDEVVGFADKKEPKATEKTVMERVDNFIDLWKRANGKK